MAGGAAGLVEVESHHRQLGAVVGGAQQLGPADAVAPRTGQTGGLVHVSMQPQPGAPALDQATDRDAADVRIQRHVVDPGAVQGGPVERGPVGGVWNRQTARARSWPAVS